MAASANMPSEMTTKLCEIEATVATGFEELAQEEVQEKFGVTSRAKRGSINFEVPISRANQVSERYWIFCSWLRDCSLNIGGGGEDFVKFSAKKRVVPPSNFAKNSVAPLQTLQKNR